MDKDNRSSSQRKSRSQRHKEDNKTRKSRSRSSSNDSILSSSSSSDAKAKEDRDAKRKSRRRTASPVPGAQAVDGKPSSSRSRKSSRPSDDEKKKHKERRSTVASKPGAESVNGGGVDRDFKSRAKRSRNSAVSPGAEMATSESRREARKTSRQMQNSKKESEIKVSDGAVANADPQALAVEAMTVDEGENNAEKMEQEIQNRVQRILKKKEDQARREQVRQELDVSVRSAATGASSHYANNIDEQQRQPHSLCNKRNICLLVLFLLAVGGGVAGYLLSRPSKTITVPEPQDVTAPTNDPVDAGTSEAPSSVESSTGAPTGAPTSKYPPPNEADCEALRNLQPIDGRDQYQDRFFNIPLEISLGQDKDTTIAMEELIQAVLEILIPQLVGCPPPETQRRLLRAGSTNKSRRLVDRYAIADAIVTGRYEYEAICDAEAPSPCYRTVLDLQLFVKEEDVSSLNLVQIIWDVFQSSELVTKLGLDDNDFVKISMWIVNNLNPTVPPSPAPSSVPSSSPTTSPSGDVSQNPTRAPVIGPSTDEPTRSPSKVPTAVPSVATTKAPTLPPTPPPTLAPVVGPTLPPTPPPTTTPSKSPSQSPSASPSLTPSLAPSARPSTIPSTLPTSGPTNSPSMVPSASPSDAPSASPSESPSVTPSTSPTVDVRPVLMDIYNAANGQFAPTSTGWDGTGNKCDWSFVDCDENDDVIRLHLERLNLDGTLSTRIGELTKLVRFDVENNDLRGKIPTEFGELTELVLIELGSNSMTGEIPSELGLLTLINQFRMWRNSFTGSIPTQLMRLTRLERLSLASNNLVGSIPTEIGRLSALSRLDLEGNALTGNLPPEITSLSALKWFTMDNNVLDGSIPVEIGDLTSLISLSMHANRFSSNIPTSIGNLSANTLLKLQDNLLVGSLPTELANLPLRVFRVTNNLLTGDVPSFGVTSIEECWMENNNFDDTTNAVNAGCTV